MRLGTSRCLMPGLPTSTDLDVAHSRSRRLRSSATCPEASWASPSDTSTRRRRKHVPLEREPPTPAQRQSPYGSWAIVYARPRPHDVSPATRASLLSRNGWPAERTCTRDEHRAEDAPWWAIQCLRPILLKTR